MRNLHIVVFLLACVAVSSVVTAQEVTPAVPGTATTEPVAATPPAEDDPRLSVCTAPSLDGFVPHIVRPGERLADLLVGTANISVTQLAALNCLDDPAALPIGAVVWVPARAAVEVSETEADTEPAIVSLTASEEAIQNQDTVTVRWEASGTEAYFYHCPPADEDACSRPALTAVQPLQHEIALSDFKYAGPVRYRLEVRGAGEIVTEDITLDVTCSQQWLGAMTGFEACPQEPPIAVFAAWQPFEGGVMLWFSDTQQIWVMTNSDHRVQVFEDTYVEGEPNPASDAPDERYTPERGFGKVWQGLGGPEGALGWALAPETGFDSARQSAGSRSYSGYIQGPGETVYAVTLIPQLEVGLWTEVTSR